MKTNKKLYFIYSYDHKGYEYTCYGDIELANFLGRSVSNTRRSLKRLNKKQKYIKAVSGIKYLILTEDDLRKG